MTAKDYPINFPYGATSAPYSPAHPHRGDDRACPSGTPVVIGSTTVGLTGATGYVFGAHLHIQEWSGTYGNTRKPQNAFKGGKVVNIDPSGTQGDGSFGKFITIQGADGWNTSYCHLSQINVKVGQVIGGTTVFQNLDEVKKAYVFLRGNAGTTAEMQGWVGRPVMDFFTVGLPEANNYRTERQQLRDQLAQVKTALANEKAKPPKEVVKEVIKVVKEPVEVPVPTTVYVQDEETRKMIKTIYEYFADRWSTFRNFIKR